MNNQSKATTGNDYNQTQAALPTFMDHIQELKGRLFYVAVGFVVSAGIAYPFFQDIINILVKPLGHQRLYYLSPAGGLSFILKVCMYAGFIGVMPVIVYQLYKFIAPVMPNRRSRAILGYTIASTLLAMTGIAFAYFVSLPAALHFLTGIDLNNITAMLTIDAYMSFIMAYLLAGALLFQLPLIMLIINSATPLKPRALMSYQRHMIVASFVMAAIVSPTPDVVNQTLLAAPIVVMYQVGIIIVWMKQKGKKAKTRKLKAAQNQTYEPVLAATGPIAAKPETRQRLQPLHPIQQRQFADVRATAMPVSAQGSPKTVANKQSHPQMQTPTTQSRVIRRSSVPSTSRRSIDGMVGVRASGLPPRQNTQSIVNSQTPIFKSASARPMSVDGFFMPTRMVSQQTV